MDLVPPVMPGQKTTYTPVRKTGATSDFVLIARELRIEPERLLLRILRW
jgi:hypothetical protein